MTRVSCVNCGISDGVKELIGGAKVWEKKPKAQIALGYGCHNFEYLN